uniref:Acetylglutamate kinase n=1 Tax=Bornetia secundiflora TaxID=2575637 RepID=A0A4D6WMV5_9FLOR|nr:acetylglutamate kinase [Bornetia secundiflora]
MLKNNFDRINVLKDLLPMIKKSSGLRIVIKYGGAAMQDLSVVSLVLEDILTLYYLGIQPIIVHGGGPSINFWLNKLNIEPKFHNGLRVTDYRTMEIVEMVLSGKVNNQLVALLNKSSSLAVGLSGKDSNLIRCSALYPFSDSDNFVGKVVDVNTGLLEILLSNNYIPVIASVACDQSGETYNINADSFAGSVASALKADKLFLLTDAPGIMADINDTSSVIKDLDLQTIIALQDSNIITGGMIPKIDACISSLKNGVKATHIIDGRFKHSLLYEIFTDTRIGSMITL